MTERRDSGADQGPALQRCVDLLVRVGGLKTTPRTGWAQRGVPSPESVADHSHGVTIAALVLSEWVPEPLDRARVLAMAALHDLPESVTGDLSLGASRLLPPGAKDEAERAATGELLDGQAFAERWYDLVTEFNAQQTLEAQLVHDADRLDLLLQALRYERSTGSRDLQDFWDFAPPGSFGLEISRRLCAEIVARRPAGS